MQNEQNYGECISEGGGLLTEANIPFSFYEKNSTDNLLVLFS